MKSIKLSDETRLIGAPANWDVAHFGECQALSVHDRERHGRSEMVSAWLPDDEELARLQAGRPLFLCVGGTTHPVVGMLVGDQPVADRSRDIAREIAVSISSAVAARIDVARSQHPQMLLFVSPVRVRADGVSVEFRSASPLEIVPPDYADWQCLGPFAEPEAEAGQ